MGAGWGRGRKSYLVRSRQHPEKGAGESGRSFNALRCLTLSRCHSLVSNTEAGLGVQICE